MITEQQADKIIMLLQQLGSVSGTNRMMGNGSTNSNLEESIKGTQDLERIYNGIEELIAVIQTNDVGAQNGIANVIGDEMI